MRASCVDQDGKPTRLNADHQTCGWAKRIGILNDYVRIPYANGSSFASQFLYRELESRGHEVSVVGPRDPLANRGELPPRHVTLPALPLRNHPGVHLPIPSRGSLDRVARCDFDLVLGQTCSALMEAGVWLRRTHGVPLLMVNTVHLPSVYNNVLPDALNESEVVNFLFREHLIPWVERQTALAYNCGNGLVVLSPGLKTYWEERGVTVPIHVIPRAVEPKIFDRESRHDPFPKNAIRGGRLLVVCRHVREKGIDRLLDIFASDVAPQEPGATLTLIGDGPDHLAFVRKAKELGVAHRTFFMGELSQTEMSDWYAHADVFVYTSLSETYGQVVTEALWCGLPVIAFEDGMGVSGQIAHGQDGALIPLGTSEISANEAFGEAILRLLRNDVLRRAYSDEARARARRRADPKQSIARYYEAFNSSREHRVHADLNRTLNQLGELAPLGKWASLHSVVFTLGLLRPPTRVNRNGSKPPAWTLERAA